MFQTRAKFLINVQKVIQYKTFTIWRVHNHHCALLWLNKILYVTALNFDYIVHHCRLDVTACTCHHAAIHIVTVDLMLEFAFCRVILVYRTEQFAVEIVPLFKSISLTEHTRCNVTCYERSLDGYSTRTAHRVNEVTLTVPACKHNHSGSKHLIYRSRTCFHAITTTVQRLTRAVEGQSTVLACYVYVEDKVGIIETYRRTLAVSFVEKVGYGIFYAVCNKF